MKLFLVPFKRGSAPLEAAEVDDMLAGRGDVQISLASDECVEVDGDVLEYLSGLGDEYRKAYSEGVGIWTRVSPRDKWRPGTVQEGVKREMSLRGYPDWWWNWEEGKFDTIEEIVGALEVQDREKVLGDVSPVLRARAVDLLETLRKHLQDGWVAQMLKVGSGSCNDLTVAFRVSLVLGGKVLWKVSMGVEDAWDVPLSAESVLSGAFNPRTRWFVVGGGSRSRFSDPGAALTHALVAEVDRLGSEAREREDLARVLACESLVYKGMVS